jgi:pimeloyl-ACP methyl ester carboxylesterase
MLRSLSVLLLLAGAAAGPAWAGAAPTPGQCQQGTLPGGALSLICVPASGWNGELFVWAHGYVAYNEPLDFYHIQWGSIYLPDLVQSLGLAFATTSYRINGLAVLEGIDDIRELVNVFAILAGRAPGRTYLVGASEGGIITALLAEQSPQLFSGALAMCGPIGDFVKQIEYFGDFRVLFDYFFPGLIPASPISIPQQVIDDWDTTYVPAIASALAANPVAAQELVRTAKAAVVPGSFETVVDTTLNVLWYNVFGTNDAAAKLGGNPFGNRRRWYWGSSNDVKLNQGVQRFEADPAALAALASYQTSGSLTIPLVTLHTTGDEVIPFWHERLYRKKVSTSGAGKLSVLPSVGYGHCEFTTIEVMGAFALLVIQVNHAPAAVGP